mmetsp:Transcript_8008/g.23611  ORF Transcript_8008/g.23611 Transcript_8008/m.23611 type:complete len:228 (-) Transcript_8008:37-720(-)
MVLKDPRDHPEQSDAGLDLHRQLVQNSGRDGRSGGLCRRLEAPENHRDLRQSGDADDDELGKALELGVPPADVTNQQNRGDGLDRAAVQRIRHRRLHCRHQDVEPSQLKHLVQHRLLAKRRYRARNVFKRRHQPGERRHETLNVLLRIARQQRSLARFVLVLNLLEGHRGLRQDGLFHRTMLADAKLALGKTDLVRFCLHPDHCRATDRCFGRGRLSRRVVGAAIIE